MSGPLILLVVCLLMPLLAIVVIKQKIKGKMVCYFIRKDRSVKGELCELRDDFVIWGNRAYDVYPDFVRLIRYPSGPLIPGFMQEIVPSSLYLEEDAVPLDWINLDNRLERAMELRSSLDENFFRKMIHETTQEAGVGGINWRKVLPIALLILGVGGLVFLLFVKGCPGGTP